MIHYTRLLLRAAEIAMSPARLDSLLQLSGYSKNPPKLKIPQEPDIIYVTDVEGLRSTCSAATKAGARWEIQAHRESLIELAAREPLIWC